MPTQDDTPPAIRTLNEAYDRAVRNGTVPDLFGSRNNQVQQGQGYQPPQAAQAPAATPTAQAPTTPNPPAQNAATAIALQSLLGGGGQGFLSRLTGLNRDTRTGLKNPFGGLEDARDQYGSLADNPAIAALFNPRSYNMNGGTEGAPFGYNWRQGLMQGRGREMIPDIQLDQNILNAAAAALMQILGGQTGAS